MTSWRPRSFVPSLATAIVLLGGAIVASACSDDAASPSSSSGTSGSTAVPDSGGARVEAGPDAASITPRPDLCQGMTRGGDVVLEVALTGDPPPPLGGTIELGTYDLVEMNAYAPAQTLDGGSEDGGPEDGGPEGPPNGPTGRSAQATIIVTQFEMRVIEARGPTGALGPEAARASLYRVDGTNILSTSVCPTTALPAPIAFSAVGTGLALFTDGTHRELYTKRAN